METKTYTIAQLWKLACQYDQIPVNSSFVVFSAGNPYAEKYNFAMRAMMVCARLAN